MQEIRTGLFDLHGRVALITGGNHGIGAATAHRLASCGARVLVSYIRIKDEPDPGIPERYRENRASDAAHVVVAIRASGGEAVSVEADLGDPSTPIRLFDLVKVKLGPVDILVNNASGWLTPLPWRLVTKLAVTSCASLPNRSIDSLRLMPAVQLHDPNAIPFSVW
jgi:NAD(P)-dependent dehydrogenase (short-subunit alcohol dehydrogenase family)